MKFYYHHIKSTRDVDPSACATTSLKKRMDDHRRKSVGWQFYMWSYGSLEATGLHRWRHGRGQRLGFISGDYLAPDAEHPSSIHSVTRYNSIRDETCNVRYRNWLVVVLSNLLMLLPLRLFRMMNLLCPSTGSWDCARMMRAGRNAIWCGEVVNFSNWKQQTIQSRRSEILYCRWI